jgi:hypothetical protein
VCKACTVARLGVVGRIWAGYRTGRGVRNRKHRRRLLGRATGGGESPVSEMLLAPWGDALSTVGHEKSCGNLGGPPSKAKYEPATDSAEVP